MSKTYNVLFLCTGNSARSILGEALMNQMGQGRFRAYSAGSYPKGAVHPMAIEVLDELHIPTANLQSKSWDEFAKPGAPQMDFVFTVCADAAGEICPVWPGHPLTAHWGIEDPAKVEDAAQKTAFNTAMTYLRERIQLFLSLPMQSIDEIALSSKLEDVGRIEGAIDRALT